MANSSLAEDVYTGVSTYGRVKTIISAIFVCLIGLIFLIFGITMIFKKNVYTGKTTGTIVSPGIIKFDVGSTSNQFQVPSGIPSTPVGLQVPIEYDPSNPSDVIGGGYIHQVIL
jgi:hypothetical protein